jgi:hypothetical protein
VGVFVIRGSVRGDPAVSTSEFEENAASWQKSLDFLPRRTENE